MMATAKMSRDTFKKKQRHRHEFRDVRAAALAARLDREKTGGAPKGDARGRGLLNTWRRAAETKHDGHDQDFAGYLEGVHWQGGEAAVYTVGAEVPVWYFAVADVAVLAAASPALRASRFSSRPPSWTWPHAAGLVGVGLCSLLGQQLSVGYRHIRSALGALLIQTETAHAFALQALIFGHVGLQSVLGAVLVSEAPRARARPGRAADVSAWAPLRPSAPPRAPWPRGSSSEGPLARSWACGRSPPGPPRLRRRGCRGSRAWTRRTSSTRTGPDLQGVRSASRATPVLNLATPGAVRAVPLFAEE
ncbi:unnamed protein product, partial [Prorocentrum cordatum]